MATRAATRCALLVLLTFTTFSANAAVFSENEIARMAEIDRAIASFAADVEKSLHGVPSTDAEQIEAYSYVELNLQAAQERLKSVFLLLAISIYMESSFDQQQILNLMHGQLLLQSKAYLNQKKDAIASMAVSHPANSEFASYRTRAAVILGDQAVPLLEELYQRIGALR
jgi:hypothetical protein